MNVSGLSDVKGSAIITHHTRQSFLLPALVAFVTALLVLIVWVALTHPSAGATSWLGSDSALVLALALLLLGLALVPVIIGRSRAGHDWFAVIYLIAGAYVLHFTFRALYVLANPDSMMGFLAYWDTFALALAYVVIGFCLLLIGYYLPFGAAVARMLPALPFRWYTTATVGKVLLIYVFGWVARLSLHLLVLPQSVLYFVIASSQFVYYAMAISIINSFVSQSSKMRWRLIWVAMLPLEVWYAFSWAIGKYYLVMPIVILLISWHYLRRRVGFRELAAAAAMVLLIIFPVMFAYRSTPGVSGMNQTLDYLLAFDVQGYFDFATRTIMIRSHLLDSVAVVVKYTPQIGGFLGVTDYVLIPVYAFVPRVLWTDKPMDRAAWFGRDFFGAHWTSVGISNPGDLYRHLGVAGVIAGMFALGVVYRLVYEFFIVRHSRDDWATKLPNLFFYIFVLFQVYLAFETDIATGFSELLKRLLFLGLVAWYIQPRRFASGGGKAA